MTVNDTADKRPTLSPKFNNPIANPPSTTVKFNQDKKVRSFAKKTLGSTRTGSAIRLPEVGSNVVADMLVKYKYIKKEKKIQKEKANKYDPDCAIYIGIGFLWISIIRLKWKKKT
jgi:hypothetical protein